MNPGRCLACLRTAARAARPTTLAPIIPLPRRLHAFAPTPPLLKKKRGGAVEEAFDDFIADEIEPDLDEPIPEVSSMSNKRSGLGPTGRHALVSSEIKNVLAYSSYRLRAFTPSPTMLASLFNNSTSPEEIDADIDLVAQWRSKGLPITDNTLDAFVRRLSKHDMAEKAVKVLMDRAKYGFELTTSSQADLLFLLFARLMTEEGQGRKHAEAASTLLALQKLFVPEGDSFATTCTVLSMINNDAQNETTTLLMKELQKMGAESVASDINLRSRTKRARALSRLDIAQGKLEAAGRNADAAFFQAAIDRVTPATLKSLEES